MKPNHADHTLEAAVRLEKDAKRCQICKSGHKLTSGLLICGKGENVGKVMLAEFFGCKQYRAKE
jgi:hypothetical protein